MKKIDYKWIMLLLISAAYFLAQGTRQIYAAVLPDIKASFGDGVSDASMGLVGSAFTLAFGIVIPFAGLAADFFRRKWIIVAGGLLFGTGILISGFASGLGMLLVAYGVMNGIGQSLMPPPFLSSPHTPSNASWHSWGNTQTKSLGPFDGRTRPGHTFTSTEIRQTLIFYVSFMRHVIEGIGPFLKCRMVSQM